MPLSRKVLIPIIAGGIAISIAIGLALAYSNGSVNDDSPGNEGNNDDGGVVVVDNGNTDDSCEPPTDSESDPGSPSGDASELTHVGNPIGTERLPTITALTLKNTEEKISFRFTAKYTGEVKSLGINLLQSTGNQTDFRVGLQSDNGNGIPTGEWIAPPGAGNTQTNLNGFITINLAQPPELLKDEVYHLVMETTEPALSLSNELRVRAYEIYMPYQPFNDENADVLWPDEEINALFYDGSTWRERNYWPIFVINYAGGEVLGQPYSLAAQWVIYQGRHTGQQIVPSADYLMEKFGFSVAAKGRPADNLCYEVRDSENNVLAKGFFAGPDDLGSLARFVEVRLEQPLTLEKDKIYKIALYSHGTAFEEPYHLYGHEFVYDADAGYGGTRNILTASYDKGSTWRDWTDADTIFTLGVH